MKTKRITIASIVAALFMSLCVFPTAANAAGKSCNTMHSYSTNVTPGYVWINMPSYNAGGGTGDFRCYLAPGASNQGVAALQAGINECYAAQLSKAGLKPLVKDGVYGAGTKKALAVVQQAIKNDTASSMVVDGLYGPTTAGAMRFKASDGQCRRVFA